MIAATGPLAVYTALPYEIAVHGVVETKAYLLAAEDAGLSEEERGDIVSTVAADPRIGDIMPGCGGARKLRVRKRGTGKSGGYRVITYFGGSDTRVFLLTVFGKNEKANLTKSERNALAGLTKTLVESLYRRAT